jgi:hypothetical protein
MMLRINFGIQLKTMEVEAEKNVDMVSRLIYYGVKTLCS